MNKIINVAYVIDTMIFGGTQTHIMQMMRGHDKTRFRPFLVCLHEKGPLGDDLEGEGFPVHALGLKRIYTDGLVFGMPRFIRFLQSNRIAVAHCYLFSAHVFGVPAARLAGTPLVIAGRRATGKYRAERRYLAARKIVNGLVHLHIANAQAVKEDVVAREGVSADRVRLVYNGVDIRRFAPLKRTGAEKADDAVVIGYVGSLTRFKRVDFLLKAFGSVYRKFPRVRLRLVGEGPGARRREKEGATDRYLRSLVAELGIADRVEFAGATKEVHRELKTMDVFVMPSISEGMSNAILEAMATGLPVIATDSGGNRELVTDGVTGGLFAEEDMNRLVAAMSELVADRERRLKMGGKGRQRVEERFSLKRMIAEMERVYSEGLAGRGE
jgi:glycosyltransferase involved in cell wall biosynthesis